MKKAGDPDFRHLRTFLVVAETMNFTRAAERLGISQPSVSVQIRDLESTLGVTLFARVGQRVSLTPAGRVLLPRAELVLNKLSDARQAVRDAEDLNAGQLSVGTVPPLSVPWMPRVLARLAREHPGLAVSVAEKSSPEMEIDVETGRFDIGVGILSRASPNLVYEHLRDDEIVLLTRPDSELGRRKSLPAKELAKLRFVLLPEGYLLRQLTQAALWRARVLPRVSLEVDTIEGVLSTVAYSGLVTLLPRVTLEGRPHLELVAVPLTGWKLPLEFGIIWPGDKDRSNAARVFADALRELVGRE